MIESCREYNSVQCIWLYVLIMLHTRFNEATLYSSLKIKILLVPRWRDLWRLSDCNWTRIYNHLVRNEHSTI